MRMETTDSMAVLARMRAAAPFDVRSTAEGFARTEVFPIFNRVDNPFSLERTGREGTKLAILINACATRAYSTRLIFHGGP